MSGNALRRVTTPLALVWVMGCGPSAAPPSDAIEKSAATPATGPARDLVFVGFDCSPPLVEALKSGKIRGLVVQNPYRMGELGVRTLVDHLDDKPIEAKVSTGETMVTPDTMTDPDNAALLDPPKADHGDDAAAGSKARRYRIMVIPKGMSHEHWRSVHAGAQKAAEDLDVEIIWKGPQDEAGRTQQIELVQSATALGVDGIVLAPLDAKALVGPVEQAVARGIPVVIIDSALSSDKPIAYVSTDNYRGGVLAAQRLGELMEGEGRALMLRYAVGSAATEEREAGFLDTMAKEFPGITFASKDQYAGATAADAQKVAQSLVTRYRGQFDGVFCPNESSSVGMLRALEGAGLLTAGQ